MFCLQHSLALAAAAAALLPAYFFNLLLPCRLFAVNAFRDFFAQFPPGQKTVEGPQARLLAFDLDTAG